MRILLLVLLFAAAPFTASAQSPDAVRFAGIYRTTYSGTFGNQTCTVRLTGNTTIFGGYGASSQGCGGKLMSLNRWNVSGVSIVLMDGNGQMLASVGPSRRALSGGTTDGANVTMTRTDGSPSGFGITPPGFNAGIGPTSECKAYYGWNGTRCASTADLAAPFMMPGAATQIMALSVLNFRDAPSFSAGAAGKIPPNSCVRTDSCGTYGGTDWCRVTYGGKVGWLAKQQNASNGRRYILFTNRCGSN